ncbi:MAG: hypothetical protein HKM95_15490 [Inquilinus sp.]|nr:hypothetical protein [Inquilinus sp.]
MAEADFSLQWILDPVDRAEFLEAYWEARPLVVARGRPDHFRHLLSLEEIDRVITTMNLAHPDVQMVNAAEDIRADRYTYRNGMIDVVKLYQLFADGSTIILPQLHTRVPPLAAFCRGLEREFGCRFQTNIYMTPGEAQGFKPHYDAHDVFVLQIAGSKDWRLYGTPVELPLKGQRFNSERHETGAVSQTFTLHPGDMLYVPRGLVHDASSSDEVSLHITTGVMASTWTDLMLDALSAVALEDVEFRRSLPFGFAGDGFDRAPARETFARLIERFAAKADLDEVLEHFVDDLVSTRHPLLQGQMSQLARLDTLTVDDEAGVRPELIHRIQETVDSVRIDCYGREISMPAHAAPAVRHALEQQRYRIADLPGDLDDSGKLVLIRRLVREGLVRLL